MTFGAPDPSRPSRNTRSRPLPVVPLAVALWAVLEIWLLTVVAGIVGGGTVLLLLLAGLVVGGYAVKRAGRRAWQGLAGALRSGGPAVNSDGAGTEMLGGLLIMVPGFLSDAVGLLCLFPPTRKALVAVAGRVLRRSAPGSLGDAFQQARSAGEQARMHWPDGKVVQGEVIRDGGSHSPDSGRDASRPPLTS